MSSQILPGQKLANGRFTLLHLLGRGGMGEVWLATDERLQEQAALKFLPSEIQADPAALDDLRKETARSRKLAHANIVRIHDLHEDADGMPFIGMEYVDGPTLAILRVQQPMRVLTWDYVRPLLGQLCLALEYAHGEKVVHRDLKPANVMVDSQGRLKLADFGIAAVVNNSMSRISMRHATSGTLAYMSPQQLSGERPQPTDDIYAMGAMLYELLTSKPPFYAGDITHQVLHKAPEPLAQRMEAVELKNEVPAEVSALVMACLAKEPGQRPQSARAVAEQIGLWGSAKRPAASLSRPAAPGPKSTDENLVPKLAQNWKWAAVGMAALVAAGLFWLWPASPRRDKSKALVEPTITNTSAAIDVSAELAKARAEMLQLSNQMAEKAADAERLSNARGGLLLTTLPAGATVLLGGEDAQTSPAIFKGIKTGRYPLRIELEGYEPVSREIEIQENQFTNLGAIPLVRQTGIVRVESAPSGASVASGGVVLGTTPLDLPSVATGPVSYLLTLDGYEPGKLSAKVKKGDQLTLLAALQKTPSLPPSAPLKPQSTAVRDWSKYTVDEVKTAAANNDARAAEALGDWYRVGSSGLAQDYAEAVKWYRLSADRGNADAQNNLGWVYNAGKGVAQDSAEAVRWYRKAADQGDALGQKNLGVMYENGRGVAQDYAEAVKWYRLSADRGNADAQNNLGSAYENGEGVAQDSAKAVKLFRLSADQGNALGQKNLAVMYENGRGVVQDYAEAVKWYRLSAEQGNDLGQQNLGAMYYKGTGVAQDYAEATKWYRLSADQGNVAAQACLGWAYEYGRGVAQDYAEAVKWYRKSADQRNAVAQINLGVMYEFGKGVAQDYAEAVMWYRKAADQGNALGQKNLAEMYEYGRGVAQDYAEAVKLFRLSADQGNSFGQNSLGEMYEFGNGVAQNYAEAVKLFRLSVDQGNAFGQINLGVMYESGRGVAQDYAEAVKWYRKAADQRNALGEKNLGEMYELGKGVAQDYAEALKLFRLSADQGNAFGQMKLGVMYEFGKGVAQDYAEALKLFRLSADQGNSFGQMKMGEMFEFGRGVAQDHAEAAKWYSKAADQGNADAKANLVRLRR